MTPQSLLSSPKQCPRPDYNLQKIFIHRTTLFQSPDSNLPEDSSGKALWFVWDCYTHRSDVALLSNLSVWCFFF